MKFTKKIKCTDCTLKCEIYHALIESGYKLKDIETVHAQYRKHENICKQGSGVTHAMLLVEGTAKLYIEGINHRNIILKILKPHNYIGLLSFFEPAKYCYSVMTLEESLVCMIELPLIKKLYKENHTLFEKLNSAFAKSSASIMNKIISLNQKQIRGRVAESLIYLSDLHNHTSFHLGLTRKELGEMCAISEENTVRILSELKSEKIISVNGREIKILDKKLLHKISEIG